MHLTGLTSFRYYLGMFLADLVLFIIPILFLILLITCAKIEGYSNEVSETTLVFLGFGMSMICLTYIYSQMFTELNRATKCLIPVYYLAGTIIPMAIFAMVGVISASAGLNEPQGPTNPMLLMVNNFFFAINPLYTFFVANYSIIMTYFEHQAKELVAQSTDA